MIYQVLERDYEKVVGVTSHGNVYGFKTAYYEFCETGYIEYAVDDIIEENGVYTYVPSENNTPYKWEFMLSDWEDVVIQFRDVQSEKYVELSFANLLHHFPPILIKKTDKNAINDFYLRRNNERQHERRKLSSYIDDNLLDIAENLVNIIEENIMLNSRVLAWGQSKYYFGNSNIFITDHEHKILKDSFELKGKEKKEVEKYNDELKRIFRDFSTIIDNFVKIIIEEKQLKVYIANAVAWETIQIKTVEYYAQLWKEEYEIHLESDFEELYEQMTGQNLDVAKREYIKEVVLCDEIDSTYVLELLVYYLISKDNYYEINLYDAYIIQFKIIQEVKEKIKSSEIQQKLRTKQHRRVNKYTINDVDLMTGAEFEEFVGSLFKKMGYSSRVTKQSGDQGLDVIASKNGTKIGIQAKCYSGTVGNSAVQEAVAGKSFYSCDKVIVITNNYFTPAAIELAQSNDVILWNRDMLKEKIRELM